MTGKARDALKPRRSRSLPTAATSRARSGGRDQAYVPKPLTSNARAEGRFDRRDFVYERESNSTSAPPARSSTIG